MLVYNGRRTRSLLPVAMAFRQLDNLNRVHVQSFEKMALISLGGIVLGTTIATWGILYKQTVLIIIGLVGIILIALILIVMSYYS